MTSSQRIVALATALLFLTWILTHRALLSSGQDALLRATLGGLFALLILRRQRLEPDAPPVPPARVGTCAVIGLAAALLGIVIPVHQLEWIGLLLLGLACLWWVLPGSRTRDAVAAVFCLYWIHPLPAQVFGPLQLAMQHASVQGTEWFLHLFDVPVWGDGLILRRGACLYDVPSWCSGMRGATTVLLLSLGLGFLRRLRWPVMAGLLSVALLQALGLNILRLAVMVEWAPSMPDPVAVDYLHDTAGLIVLANSLLLVFELWLWERYAAHRTHRALEPDVEAEVARRSRPAFWATLYGHRWTLATAPLAILIALGVLTKSLPSHRLAMRQAAVDGLQRGDELEAAFRLATLILQQHPDDHAWQLTVLKIQVQRGDYATVLERLDTIGDTETALSSEKRMLRAYCLMGLGRINEAAALVRELPSDPDNPDPRAAMILAELARQSDEPDRVAEYVRIASQWGPNLNRIRKLYPYLRRHRKWDVIASSDRKLAYRDPVQILCAAEAAMNLNHSTEVATLTEEALRQWPDDARMLEPLFYLAAKQPGTVWEDRFTRTLTKSLRRMTQPDEIYELFDKCFSLGRPDLAWLVHLRLAQVDATHPGLPLSVARHGGEWGSFRTRTLGMDAPHATDRTDLMPFLSLSRNVTPWRDLWHQIPQASLLDEPDTVPARKRALDLALATFSSRAHGVGLSLTMQYAYSEAMEMAGDLSGATQQLARTAAAFPTEAVHTTLLLSEIHERHGDWETLYEILRPWAGRSDLPLALWLRLCRAETHLNLGLAALETSRRAAEAYPLSTEAIRTRASTLRQFDSPEEALFYLGRPRIRRDTDRDVLQAELLYLTHRNGELLRFVEQASLPGITPATLPAQPLFLPPAEQAVLWHRLSLPSKEEFAHTTETLRRNLKTATSPFMRSLMTLWLEASDSQGSGDTLALNRWRACGRDTVEQATALNQLCLQYCQRRNLAGATQAAIEAARSWPRCATLWRIAVSLSQADAGLIAEARQACPTDSELWLAEIVSRSRKSTGLEFSNWAEAAMIRATKAGTFSADAMTRAGEYLVRGGILKAASIAARDAAARNHGLLPASVLAVQCALRTHDKDWALSATRQAMLDASDPLPALHRIMAEIRCSNPIPPLDEDMVVTLKQLRRNEPDNTLWAEMLTYILFYRDNWTEMMRCLSEASSAIEAGSKKRSVFILGAEAARQMKLNDRAVALLRQGLAHYPGDVALLNNLAYTLAQDTNTLTEATRMIPGLAPYATTQPQIHDTIATIWLQAGNATEAEPWISRMDRIRKNEPNWQHRLSLLKARLAALKGKPEEVRKWARSVLLDNHKASNEELAAAETLLREAEAAARKPNPAPGSR